VLDASCKLLGCTNDSVAVPVAGAAEGPFDADATVPSAATTSFDRYRSDEFLHADTSLLYLCFVPSPGG